MNKIILIILVIITTTCSSENGVIFSKFEVNPKLSQIAFNQLTDEEKEANSINPKYYKNRARLELHGFRNGVLENKVKGIIKTIPLSCTCSIQKDTLQINAGIDMMGGFGVNIKLHKDKFESSFYEHTSGIKPYMKQKNSTPQSYISVNNNTQKLVLNQELIFDKKDQNIYGQLAFKSNTFYENILQDNKIDARYLEGKLWFICGFSK